ncbi:MAG: PilZ domain-containing protein [Parvibaculum sp.]
MLHSVDHSNGQSDGAERRRAPRKQVAAAGRLMVTTGLEYPCQVLDISENGVAFNCQGRPAVGDKIIAYLDYLGRFEGKVTRLLEAGFAIETHLPDNQRQRLLERIEWLENGAKPDERRIASRRLPSPSEGGESAVLVTRDGERLPCRVLDISMTGTHVQVRPRPDIGTHVTVGRMLGRVVRHTHEGVGIEFLDTSTP